MARNPVDIYKFIQSLKSLASKGNIKIDDAYKAAKLEFGEVSNLLKLQINKIFQQSKAPSIKKPENKPGEVIEASFKPGMDKRGRVVEESPSQASGIMKTDEASPLMKNIEDVKQNIKGMSENNPKTFRMSEEQRNALGYPNRMIEGIIRTAAREILSKKGIDVSKADPIDTFADIFGVNALERLEDVSDELLSAQDYNQLNSILQKNELYDVTPKSGLNLKQSDEIEELTEFDPTDRKPNAMGGRIGFENGGSGYSFGYKPGKEFQLNVSSMGKGTIKEIINSGELTSEDLKAAMDALKDRKAEGGRIGYAMGGMNRIAYRDGTKIPKLINTGKKVIDSGKKGLESLKSAIGKIMSKYGDDAIMTADKAPQPPKTDRQIISEFEARNPSPSRELTDDEIADLAEEVGELDAYDFDGTVGSANRIRNEVKAYEADMLKQYEAAGGSKRAGGPKDPVAEAIDNVSPGFANDLKYDAQLVADDLAEKRFGKEFYDLDQNQQMDLYDEAYQALSTQRSAVLKKKREPIPESIKEGVADVMRDTSPAGLEKSLEIDNLMLKYPGISIDFADQIASSSPIMKADMIAMVEQTFKMDEMGMSGDEIIDTFKNTKRTKQANGGLSYLMGM
jgi:hypothetical protein